MSHVEAVCGYVIRDILCSYLLEVLVRSNVETAKRVEIAEEKSEFTFEIYFLDYVRAIVSHMIKHFNSEWGMISYIS